MRTDTLFMIGGCSGSFAAPTENRPVYDASAPWNVRRVPFRRELYGSRTTSYFLRHKDTLILIDQGLGAAPISEFVLAMLEAEGKKDVLIHCVQTHFHQDHIAGLRANELLFRRGITMRFYSPDLGLFRTSTETMTPGESVMKQVLQSQFRESYWPVTIEKLDEIGAHREHVSFVPSNTLQIDDITVRTILLAHPGGCSGFRFEVPGVGAIVVATDYEPPAEPEADVVEFFDDAQLLLADIQYRDDEYEGKRAIGQLAMSRQGWGHGTPKRTLPTILACKRLPKRVRIVHHDPKRSDMELRYFYEETVNLLEDWNAASAFDYRLGHDGDIFWF